MNDNRVISALVAIDVLGERIRQVEKLKWTTKHDDDHDKAFLRFLAIQKILASGDMEVSKTSAKMLGIPLRRIINGTPRQLLVQAAALIVAAIEREDRIEARLAKQTVPAKPKRKTKQVRRKP